MIVPLMSPMPILTLTTPCSACQRQYMSALCCSVTLHDWVAWQSCVLEQEEEDNPRRTLSNAPRREPYPYI